MNLLLAVGCVALGGLVGCLVDGRIRRAAEAEIQSASAAQPAVERLDRHLTGARWRGFVVPVLSGLACLLAALRWGPHPILLPFLFFLPILVGLAVVDLHTRRLPNVLTVPGLLAGLVLVAGSALIRGEPAALISAVLAGLLLFGSFLVLALLRPAGMGMGDVKVAGLIGLFVGSLGIGAALVSVVLAAFLAWLAGLLLMLLGLVAWGKPLPFGPWLAAGALIGVLAGPQLFQAYLGAL